VCSLNSWALSFLPNVTFGVTPFRSQNKRQRVCSGREGTRRAHPGVHSFYRQLSSVLIWAAILDLILVSIRKRYLVLVTFDSLASRQHFFSPFIPSAIFSFNPVSNVLFQSDDIEHLSLAKTTI